MVANTTSSNMFLLTLCLGIDWVSPHGEGGDSRATIGVVELITSIASSVAMCIAAVLVAKLRKGTWARYAGGVYCIHLPGHYCHATLLTSWDVLILAIKSLQVYLI
jgi:hypothetical protein